ncbi:MAG TPA: DNA primase, partial [Myxococcaceae bacterium]|nr:DNA primase [Myxococcaceae bacterium]
RERTDIVALISRYVELKKSGRSYKGRCPFHEERTASFHVTPEMHRFKCFGCQAGGDAIAFVQRYLGKSFVDSVRELAREAGVELEGAADPSQRERQQIKEATDFAAEHFRSRLWDEEKGRKARDYLHSRGVEEAVARAFGMGWAPTSWSELSDKLLRAGMLEWGAKAGLVQKRASGEGYYDLFRGRLIIPIRSPEGRTIAFGGRLLEGDDGPKYLNSRESVLYRKSEILYGMDQAREEIRRRKAAVLVEGYFDCIGMHRAGVKNALALCSTALTPGHLAALARAEAKELLLLLDGDEAGRKAVERLAGPLLAAGSSTKVALLPEGEDPDTFARRSGAAAVLALLAEARPLSEHLFHSVLPAGRSATFEEKMSALERLRAVAAQLSVGLTRSAFFSALAAHSGLPAAELEAALKGKVAPPKPVPKPPPTGVSTRTQPARSTAAERPPDALEAAFVAVLLRDRGLAAREVFFVADELSHPGLRAAAAELIGGAAPEEVLFEATGAVKEALAEASGHLPEGDLERAFLACCRKLKVRRIDEQLAHIARITGQVPGASELTDETRRLQAERVELLALKRRVLEDGPFALAGTKTTAPGV